MKLKVIKKILNPMQQASKNTLTCAPFTLYHVHSLLLGGCLSLSEPHSCIFGVKKFFKFDQNITKICL